MLAGAALFVLLPGGAARAGFFSRPYDLSLGAYNGGWGYSYNVAYSYGLPFTSAAGYSLWAFPYDQPYRPYRPARSYPSPSAAYGLPPAEGPLPALAPVPTAEAAAVVEVSVPEDAEVWFDGQKTRQSGAERLFYSPPLPPGGSYLYVVRARWSQGGKPVEQMKAVPVQAGQRVRVRFSAPPPAEAPDGPALTPE